MSRKRPILDLQRISGTSAELTFPNWEGEDVYIYRAEKQNNQFQLLTTVTAGTYTDTTLEAGKVYKYYIRMTDFASSIIITEDHTDETPPYYTVETIGASDFSDVEATFAVDWGPDLVFDVARVSNVSQGLSSIGKYTK